MWRRDASPTRANERYEYGAIHQRIHLDSAFHVERIVSTQHGRRRSRQPRASCHLCSSRKGPNLSGLDPETGALTRLFHPRKDRWHEHFRTDENGQILGLTDIGRTTVHLLDMNSEIRTRIRREILRLGGE
ncbi:MAG TPA: HNH endonuclease [Vicinamibacteria bacterium]|nr:HNH endonuclease [Vicinamibacteria bacterium]